MLENQCHFFIFSYDLNEDDDFHCENGQCLDCLNIYRTVRLIAVEWKKCRLYRAPKTDRLNHFKIDLIFLDEWENPFSFFCSLTNSALNWHSKWYAVVSTWISFDFLITFCLMPNANSIVCATSGSFTWILF